jgi:hypothetical protein
MAASSPTFDVEWSLLRAACSASREGLTTQIDPGIRWNSLFELAEQHGVLPLLYQTLSTQTESVPVEEFGRLKQNYQANLHKVLFLSCEFVRIAECLDSIGVEFLPYKGLALAETVYGDVALRQSGDIDLLIHPHDLPKIRKAVGELGFIPHTQLSEAEERAYLESGYECAFDSAAGRNLLEVQWAIQPRFYAVDYEMTGVFERSVPVSVAGCTVKTLCLEDLFIVLSLHAAKHVWARLIWLCDLARVMSSSELNWNWIGLRATELGITRVLRVSLLLANRILSATIPAAADSNLPKDLKAEAIAEEIEKLIVMQTDFNVESFGYFQLMLQLRERKADRMRFLARLVFTPGSGEWDAVRLPRPLFPLYRVIRIFRLAGRVIGV